MSFTEREAIKFEMEELKEQARRDFEIYLTSRNMRNERYTQLMDRLREIDERSLRNKGAVQTVREIDNFIKKREESTPLKNIPQPKWEGTIQDLRVDKIRPNQEIIVTGDEPKSEPEKPKIKGTNRSLPKSYVKLEDIDPVVEKYLRFRGTEEKSKDIQKYVEKELNTKWVNFTAIMTRVLEANPNIHKAERKGFYFYGQKED